MASTSVSFSFLTSGPRFQAQLPDPFQAIPELNSPLSNGHGDRAFTFVPAQQDHGIRSDNTVLLRTIRGGDGRSVELFKRLTTPPLWWLRWPLPTGAVYTHLREEDGEGYAEVTAAALSIAVAEGTGLPFLTYDKPLAFAASTVPDYQEGAAFFSREEIGPPVRLLRPGFLRKGQTMTAPSGSGQEAMVRAGAGDGIEVQATGDDERRTRDMVDAIAASVKVSGGT